jgi:hypothetical protein
MQALIQAVYNAVMEFYDYAKPWKQDFAKFTVKFDEQAESCQSPTHPFRLSTQMHSWSKSEKFDVPVLNILLATTHKVHQNAGRPLLIIAI